MTKRAYVIAVLTVALAGCSLAPPYERPALPVPATYPDVAPADAVASPPNVPWESFFTDQRLVNLIGIALENNRDLRVAVLNIEQARAQFRVQRAALFPQVDLRAGYSRLRPGSADGGVATNHSVDLGVAGWEIDFFGRISSMKDAALAQYLATEEARKAVQVSLISSVATGWLRVLADDQLLEVTRQTLAGREETARLMKMRWDSGASSELDYQLARSLAESARAVYAQQRRARMQDENALVLLLGAPVPAGAFDGVPGLDGVAVIPDVAFGLPSELIARRPDIRAAEQRLIGANVYIGAARAAFFPRISLTTSVGTLSSDFANLFQGPTKAWTFAPQLVLPLFDAGTNQANLDAARAARDIAVAQYDLAVQSAFREVADTIAARETLGDEVQALEATAAAEQARFQLAELRFKSGIASSLDLLDAQRSLFAARLASVNARLQSLQNQVLVYTALGGGWSGT